jgi:RNA polymerase-binding transcription factor DksA
MLNQYDEAQFLPIDLVQELSLSPDLDPPLQGPARKLVERYREIRQAMEDSTLEDEDNRPHFSNHLAEDASDAIEWQSRAAVSHHLSSEMQQIEHAYALLQCGRYGQCEQCGHMIPYRRMEIKPFATLCVNCQARLETGH